MAWVPVVVLIVALSTVMVVYAGPGDHVAPPAPAESGQSGGTVHAPSVSWVQLADLGWSPEEAQTAISLQEQTGIPALTLLEDRKAGKSWLEIVNSRAKGMKLGRKGKPAHDTPAIAEDAIRALVAKGHARMDVLEAASLAREYGKSAEQVLAMKSPELTWQQVEAQLRAAEPPKTKPDHLPPGLFDETGRTRTKSRLTEAEVWALIDQGFTLEDFQMGEHAAAKFGMELKQLLARRKAGRTWTQIIDELLSAQAAADHGRPQADADPGLKDTAMTLGVTQDRVKELRGKGYSDRDLLMAQTYAKLRGVTLETQLAEFDQKGRDWNRIGIRQPSTGKLDRLTRRDETGKVVRVDRSASGLTLSEVNALLDTYTWEEVEQADLWAARLNLDARALLKARGQGKSWDQVLDEAENGPAGSRLADVLAALGVDPQHVHDVGLTRAQKTELEAMGLSIRDIHLAAVIAHETGRPLMEVAALKTAENTWADVALLAAAKGGGH